MATTANVKLSKLRKFLKERGCKLTRTRGGHEIWTCPGLTRPIVIQTHINPVPEFIILQIIRTLGISKKEFLDKI